MTHEWHAGVLSQSSWHGLEQVGAMADADAQIAAGERSGAWPVTVGRTALHYKGQAGQDVMVKDHAAIVGTYADGSQAALGVVGGRYVATTPENWRDLCRAAVAAGARPTGAFALREGTRVLATFDVGGNGIRTQLVLCDTFDGSMRLTAGTTSVRVVCANTLAVALSSDGKGMAQLRHTASLESKCNALKEAIGTTIATGETVRAMYDRASSTRLTREAARAAFDALFPEAPKDAPAATRTKLENARTEARQAAVMGINRGGAEPGNVATLWNAATFVLDRDGQGRARKARGGADMLDSMLFGARAKRIEEIQTVIELCMRDGSVEHVTAQRAIEMGADLSQVGAKVLEDILNDG